MRIRYTIWSVLALLIGSATMGYGARLPTNGDGNSSTTTTSTAATAPAKVAPAKPAATGVHSTKTSTTAKRRVAHPAVLHAQLAPTASRISEIQSALSRQGAYQGQPNGRWDTATIDAMRQFQTDHGLNPSGKIDALTLQKLGLGSQVSGMGAPLPLAGPQASAADSGDQTQHP
jgi:peptidoglycan hydrolase-like protein with peptidoglycan-binding domain